MTCCRQQGITDAAFKHLGKLTPLLMSRCNQSTITDAMHAAADVPRHI